MRRHERARTCLTKVACKSGDSNAFMCLKCGEHFNSYSGVYQHHRSIHSDVKPACNWCGKTFNRMDNMKRHAKSCKSKRNEEPETTNMEPNYQESPTDGSPNTSSEPQQEQDSNSSNYNAIEEWFRELRDYIVRRGYAIPKRPGSGTGDCSIWCFLP